MADRNAFLYPEALDFLSSFEQSNIKLGLQRIRELLNALGHPQQSFCSVHVAGTNGKGSVSAMLDNLLASENQLIGRFCSPHLITPRERILIDSRPVTRQWFSASLSYLRDVLDETGIRPSYFELITALAFYVFRFMEVDIAVVETGLGGRLDATNTLAPDLTVITSISLDHTGILGESIPVIALEKAGIIKPGVPVVVLNGTEAFPWIETTAKKMSSPLIPVTPDVVRDGRGKTVVSVKRQGREIRAAVPLSGTFQVENLALALAAFQQITGISGDVSERFSNLNWPGRMETLPTSPPILLDGAHNPAAMIKLLDSLGGGYETGLVVFGCMRDKNAEDMYRLLRERFPNIVLTAGAYHRFMDRLAFEGNPIFDSSFLELSQVIEKMESYPFVMVTGSLHLIGDFLKQLARNHRYREVLLEIEPYSDIFDSDPA